MTTMTQQASGNRAYRAGVGVAIAAAFLTVWTTIVRDDGNGIGYFMVILGALVGAFAAWFRPAGMARTMVGVAVMELCVGSLIATAPITQAVPGASLQFMLYSGAFAGLWLISAAFFGASAKVDR